MAPSTTEYSILELFLLIPASLPQFLPFKNFTLLFPTNLRSHPQLKPLYRDLQFLRSVDVDVVRENIEKECGNGPKIQGQMLRELQRGTSLTTERGGKRKHGTGDGVLGGADKVEIQLDGSLFGPTGMLPRHNVQSRHDLDGLLLSLEKACETVEEERARLEGEADELLRSMTETVDGLSDLKLRKFARHSDETGVEKKVAEALRELTQACDLHGKE